MLSKTILILLLVIGLSVSISATAYSQMEFQPENHNIIADIQSQLAKLTSRVETLETALIHHPPNHEPVSAPPPQIIINGTNIQCPSGMIFVHSKCINEDYLKVYTETDKEVYHIGDTVHVSGKVRILTPPTNNRAEGIPLNAYTIESFGIVFPKNSTGLMNLTDGIPHCISHYPYSKEAFDSVDWDGNVWIMRNSVIPDYLERYGSPPEFGKFYDYNLVWSVEILNGYNTALDPYTGQYTREECDFMDDKGFFSLSIELNEEHSEIAERVYVYGNISMHGMGFSNSHYYPLEPIRSYIEIRPANE